MHISKLFTNFARYFNFVTMINRTLVRTRVVQILYAYNQCGDKTPSTAQKELLRSFSDTYSLYFMILDFVNELTTYAENQIAESIARSRATHRTYHPNRRFVENRFAKQLFENLTLRHYLAEEHLSWEAGQTALAAIYTDLQNTPFYKEYMALPQTTYSEDKAVWRKIIGELLPDNPDFLSALEELEVALDRRNWTVDADIVLSYVVKSIRQFREENEADQALLQMFDREDELQFAQDLLAKAIEHHDEEMEYVHQHLKNWDADRLALMDTVILQAALAELLYFPDIALEVTLNEYIELSKEYSGEKSYLFVNGILNEILLDLKRNNKLLKALTLK